MSDTRLILKVFAAAFLIFALLIFLMTRVARVQPGWAREESKVCARASPGRAVKAIEIIVDGTVYSFFPGKEFEKKSGNAWEYTYPASNAVLRRAIDELERASGSKLTGRGTTLLAIALRDGLPVKVGLPFMRLLAGSSMPVGSDPASVNMMRAAELINGTVIPPGGEFSFNQAVGPRTLERGFVESISIYGDKWVPDVGGGVCRTATLLHQAAQEADLKITEKHGHSLPVSYAAKGEDIAVAWRELDYRFCNTTGGFILIEANVDDEMLKIQVFAGKEGG